MPEQTKKGEETLAENQKEIIAYPRMLDKETPPNEEQIQAWLGPMAAARLQRMEKVLFEQYRLSRLLRFPYGKSNGWGYKYSHGTRHLCDIFFEKGAFTVMMQLGDPYVEAVEALLPQLQLGTRALWEDRYLCGLQGGWILLRVYSDREMEDALRLLSVRCKPPQKK